MQSKITKSWHIFIYESYRGKDRLKGQGLNTYLYFKTKYKPVECMCSLFLCYTYMFICAVLRFYALQN